MAEGIRLSKVIAARGVASRREAETLIEEGRVTVNSELVSGVVFVTPDDEIKVDGRPLPPEPPRVYYLLYKPRGYITGRNDPEGRKSVLEFVKDLRFRVEPVGRLDFDTEGALLLTNDGDLAHQLTHPSRKVPKRYLAKVYRTPSDKTLAAISSGVFLEDGRTHPAKVRVTDTTDKTNAWVEPLSNQTSKISNTWLYSSGLTIPDRKRSLAPSLYHASAPSISKASNTLELTVSFWSK